jgi:hypothetical protein
MLLSTPRFLSHLNVVEVHIIFSSYVYWSTFPHKRRSPIPKTQDSFAVRKRPWRLEVIPSVPPAVMDQISSGNRRLNPDLGTVQLAAVVWATFQVLEGRVRDQGSWFNYDTIAIGVVEVY